MLTVGSLFSGIGGLELGLERTGGFQTEWQVEINGYCQQVLAKHWPDVTRYGDIRTVGKHNLQPVDVICGGFPCQPHSLAGKRKASEDERDLWGEFYRIICDIRPSWVLAENVQGLLSSEDGRFFGRVLRDLAGIGYYAEWQMLRACEVGAPHTRARVFILAYPGSFGRLNRGDYRQGRHVPPYIGSTPESEQEGERRKRWTSPASPTMADAQGNNAGRYTIGITEEKPGFTRDCQVMGYPKGEQNGRLLPFGFQPNARATSQQHLESGFPPKPGLGRVFNGVPARLDGYNWPSRPGQEQYEWEPTRTITDKIPHRYARLKALGNAVVPQVAEYIGNCILAAIERETSER